MDWCKENNLCINVEKTKERWTSGGEAVEVVTTVKYLGLYISNNLRWFNNMTSIIKKAHQTLSFMRKLKQAAASVLLCYPPIGAWWRAS